MRAVRVLAIGLVLSALLCFAAAAAEADLGLEVDPEAGLSEEILSDLGPFSADEPASFGEKLLQLLSKALRALSPSLRQGLAACGIMLAAVLLCSLMEQGEGASDPVRLAGVLAIMGACAGRVGAMITLAGQTVTAMREYSVLLLPSLAGLTAFSGGSATGAAVYAGGVIFFELLLRLSSGLVLPLCWMLCAVSAANAALGDDRLGALGGFLRWTASTALRWTGYLFTGYLAVSGVLGGAADAARLRLTQLAISGAVPVVGGIISEASGAVLSASGLLKNAVGVYGMLAVLAICAAPFLQLAVQMLLLKAAAAISGLFGQSRLTGLISELAGIMGLLLALTGTFCLAALLSMVLLMKAVGG